VIVVIVHVVQEYALNLSISLRAGKETNLDFFSNGERTRKSSNGNIKSCVYCSKEILWKEEPKMVIAHNAKYNRGVVLLGNAV